MCLIPAARRLRKFRPFRNRHPASIRLRKSRRSNSRRPTSSRQPAPFDPALFDIDGRKRPIHHPTLLKKAMARRRTFSDGGLCCA
jgi:hypothetical protein